MSRVSILVLSLLLAGGVQASWYWPFGADDEADKEPPRISELMEPATLLIDEAADLAADGKVDESVEAYRKALAELDRIERENPDRAKSQEFATLRNKRAYVNAAIDSMLMSQVKANARAVAVSDTTALERKYAAERARRRGEDAPSEAEATGARPTQGARREALPPSPRREPERPVAPARSLRDRAMNALARGDFGTAERLIDDMLAEKPNGAAALNLRAALEAKQGKLKAAEATLDQAIMSNPRSPFAYYNMARLLLGRGADGVSAARRYYETGRAVGGAVDAELEEALK